MTPTTEAGRRKFTLMSQRYARFTRSEIAAIEDEARASLDVELLYRAMVALDSDVPGVFDIVGISEPDTHPVAEALAAVYAALAASPHRHLTQADPSRR